MKRIIQIGLLSLSLAGCTSFGGGASTGFSTGYGSVPPAAGAAASDLASLLEGCVIVADDGQVLGVITRNEFAANSILNQFGPYGSEFSATSIFNQFGKYGGQFSSLSPFNEFTNTPPQIITTNGQRVGHLSKNKFVTGAIDPYVLIALLKSAK